MKVCILQPDYSTTDVDYKKYDPPRNLASLLPGHQVDHVFLNKLTVYKQLKDLRKQKYDIFVNLCEGYLDWSIPSIDVIHTLDLLNLPYTGPNTVLYDPSKPLMKYVAYCAGVKTPLFAEISQTEGLLESVKHLSYPLFVKPAKAGDSLGVDEHSRVTNGEELRQKVENLLAQGYDEVLVEEYIAGREFTVLVAAKPLPERGCLTFKPVEYQFPEGYQFKTYSLKTTELHADVNKPIADEALEARLRASAERIFTGFTGVGYARMDFRVNADGEIFFLEVNFTCSVFYEDGFEGSADYILKYDPIGKDGFLKLIIEEGRARHKARQKKYRVKGNSINGYGIVAQTTIAKGEVIFELEEAAQRLVTKRHVEEHWFQQQKEEFSHYAYPVSDEVYILWDLKPEAWAPHNHSCNPNTTYQGLNLVALRGIQAGEELTLDYAELLNDTLPSFVCTCGAPNCRKVITGRKDNSITQREKLAKEKKGPQVTPGT